MIWFLLGFLSGALCGGGGVVYYMRKDWREVREMAREWRQKAEEAEKLRKDRV